MRLEAKIASLLTRRKQTLAVAESCTGGLLAHTLTNVPGSSAFFLLGVVAYDNAAKVKILGVPAAVLKEYGAVSPQVAEQMAAGVRQLLKTNFGIGVTGIAGPSGGSALKPVGLIYVAVTGPTSTIVKKFRFKGSRSKNKSSATQAALRILCTMLA